MERMVKRRESIVASMHYLAFAPVKSAGTFIAELHGITGADIPLCGEVAPELKRDQVPVIG